MPDLADGRILENRPQGGDDETFLEDALPQRTADGQVVAAAVLPTEAQANALLRQGAEGKSLGVNRERLLPAQVGDERVELLGRVDKLVAGVVARIGLRRREKGF